ncbi:MAG: PDDEXK nuclease domain-containing protein [Spirochaetaceae bacterium]|jgi:predicted nuclease of restriction endonuclease-like (RecB) superfamily|nr:PDDEXK nuclease domain-containing protein [Spirochaetaceae bacterium]
MDDRKHLGKRKKGVIIPATPPLAEMDASYFELLALIKERIGKTRLKVVEAANTEMITMYWDIGNDILTRQTKEGWGAKVIDRLSADLSHSFPDMKGFSPRNLGYMKRFASLFPDPLILQRSVAKLQWRSVIALMDKLKDNGMRLLYADETLKNGWSGDMLRFHIDNKTVERSGKSVNNFAVTLPPLDSDMANHIFKDPYLFDFVGTDGTRREREVENQLVEHIQKFLLELGQGFAFVGRQVHLEVENHDFYIDLLFYHLALRCYVVIELKACEFEPEFIGQLNFYQNVVDDILRHPDDKPTIGLLLVKGKNKTVVEYSLAGNKKPIGVADWQTQLTTVLPDDLKASLPSIEEIEKELEAHD